jgi:hypothetical protein
VKTVAAGFEAKLLETVATGFEAKPMKTIAVVLRINRKTRAPRLYMHGTDLCEHPRPSSPGLLLLSRSSSLHAMPHLPPAHLKTSKHDSPNETKIKVKQNKTIPDLNSKLTNSMTHRNQTKKLTTWFLNLPLDEFINNKNIKFKVRIQDPMKHI